MTAGWCAAPRHAEPPPAEAGAWLCHDCCGRLRHDVTALPRLDRQLAQAEVASGHDGDGTGLPFSEPVADHRHHMRALAVSWALAVADEGFRGPFPQDTLPAIAAYLAGAVTWCSFRRWSGDMAGEFAAAVGRARALADPWPHHTWPLLPGPDGVCTVCDTGRLIVTAFARADDARPMSVTCDRCGCRWEETHQLMLLGRMIAARRGEAVAS